MLSPVRLSVTRVHQSKTVEVRIMKFSPYGSPILPVLVGGKFDPEILRVSPSGVSNKGHVGKTRHFIGLNVKTSKTVGTIYH